MKTKIILCFVSLCFIHNVFAQSTANKNVSSFTIDAPQLNMEKKIWMYIPNSYHSSNKYYPVIYMHDAQNLFDNETSYVGEWKVDEHLDILSENEAIIVGIEHGNEKRIDELTPYAHPKYGGGNGENYLEFIMHTLKPHIDVTYRTLKDSENTTIFGSSLGGLISFYAAIKYPDTFGKAGVFSPSFWFSEKIYELAEQSMISETSKFYFLVGSKEGENVVADQEKMVTLLKEKKVGEGQVINRIIEGGEHNEAFWSTYFTEAFLWLSN